MSLSDTTLYPGGLDVFPDINAVGGDLLSTVGREHDALHDKTAKAVRAIQDRLGTTAAPVADFMVGPPAAGTAAGKDKAAAEAARAAAEAAPRGGRVVFGAGDYNVGDWNALLPPYSSGKQVSLAGAGREATRVKWSTDTGAGTYAIRGSAARETDSYFCSISDMAIIGPHARPATIGTWPANSMSGIRWDRGVTIERCDISGFYVGVESDANHSYGYDCTISNNYYGVYFTANSYSGDVVMSNWDLGGNLMASIAVSGTHADPAMSDGLATYCMVKGHMGFSPYGVYVESGAGAGLSMGGVLMLGTSWEFIGNGAIFSADQTARIDGLVLIGNGNFSSSPTTYKIAAQPHSAHIKVATLRNATFVDTYMTGTGPADAWIDATTEIAHFEWRRFRDSYNAANTAGKPFIRGVANQSARNIVLDGGEALTAFAAPCSSFFAIAAGEIVERRAESTLQPYGAQGATSKGQIAGVALNGVAASSREYIICATKCYDQTILCDAAIGITDVLVPSTANPSKVVGLQSDGTTATVTKPIVGRPRATAAGAGTVQANLDIR